LLRLALKFKNVIFHFGAFEQNKWEFVASPTPKHKNVHVNLLAEFQNQILMISSGVSTGWITLYDPETNLWTEKDSSPEIRYLSAAALCHSPFYG
jgi:hypothetical protein